MLDIQEWEKNYVHAIKILSTTLDLISEKNTSPLQGCLLHSIPLPTHFDEHNALIEQVLSIFMTVAKEDGYFFNSKNKDSSLEKLRWAIHFENERLQSVDYLIYILIN